MSFPWSTVRSTPAPARWRERLWLLYLAAGAVATALYLWVPPLRGSGPLINLLGLSSPLAIALGMRLYRPAARLPWLLFILGQSLYFAGDLYTYSYRVVFHAEVPFPGPGDALYLLVYPALISGLLVLVRRRNRGRDGAGLIDSLILSLSIALLSWVFLIVPNLHLSGLTELAKGVSAAYPLGDVLLLAAAIRLAVDRGRRAPAFYLLAASIVALLSTDSVYARMLLDNTYAHQLWLDAGWIAYYMLWGAAALHPSMRTLEEPAFVRRQRLTHGRLAVLAGTCLIAPAIRFAAELHHPAILVVVASSALLYLLVVARMAGLVRNEERAAELRTAGVELVGAASPQKAYEAALAAVGTVAGPTAPLALVFFGAEPLLIRSLAGTLVQRSLSEADTGGLAASAYRLLTAAELPASVRAELFADPADDVLLLPLSVRGTCRGALLLSGESAADPRLLEPLEGLAAQIALAVDGAALAEDSLRRESEARFRALVANSSDVISVLDAAGAVVYQSPAVEQALGYTPEDVEGTPFARLVVEADRTQLASALERVGDDAGRSHVMECGLRHRDGHARQFEVRVTNLLDEPNVEGIVVNSRDVSDRKAFEEQLEHQAFHDPVTGLANRALFADRVRHALARSARGGEGLALLFVDLDDFKTINDSLGHASGDLVLREVARRLGDVSRQNDTVARFGGDEFAVLLDGVAGLQDAADVTERVLGTLADAVTINGKQVYPHASIGVCIASEGQDAEELLRNADVAMYMAKREGKGRYRVFEPAMHERVLERLELRADLHDAAERGELAVHYQPLVELAGERVYGVEALLRWTHPTRGNVPPSQFIPIAEETGLIVPIGRWLLQQTCAEAVRLQERFALDAPLRMSVNLSVKQLQSDDIVADVRAALDVSGLDPSSLVLEITESMMMADTELAVERLVELKGLGVRLAMDDFGTGYSSLSYLSRMPVDILKMDRSFLATGEAQAGLAAAIVALGESLDLAVVAEGIEHPEQLAALRRLGCALGQGFLFARPLDADSLHAFLEEAGSGERRAA